MAVNVTRATHVCRFVRTWRCDGGCYEGECREQRPSDALRVRAGRGRAAEVAEPGRGTREG